MGANPSVFQGRRLAGDADRHPVDNVTWEDAQAFVRRLNAADTTARYRLPTEFEWEWAARAGADSEPSWPQIRESAWIQDVDKGSTHPVGGKAPNAWGLHDTLGNVWEWMQDCWHKNYEGAPGDGSKAWEEGGDCSLRVLRGGSWFDRPRDVRSAARSGFEPVYRTDALGFRLAQDID
jgi:formylglycine-generating enzyme required for sulfatase activity